MRPDAEILRTRVPKMPTAPFLFFFGMDPCRMVLNPTHCLQFTICSYGRLPARAIVLVPRTSFGNNVKYSRGLATHYITSNRKPA